MYFAWSWNIKQLLYNYGWKAYKDETTTKYENTQQINAFSPSSNQDQFYLQKVNYNQVLHEIKSISSDCSTGVDIIP